MPQIYPCSLSDDQSVTINTDFPMTGGGVVPLGGSLTLGLSSTQSSFRNQYSTTPAADGTIANFTIVGVGSALSVAYADVYVSGVLQNPANYTLSGNQLSFNTAPAASAPIYAVFSQPGDNRQFFTLGVVSSTVFSFPVPPQGTYVDIYVSGVLQVPVTTYNLDIVNGVYTVVFLSAPAATPTAVYDPSTNSGRNLYGLSPAPNSSVTAFTILGGNPNTSYIDVYTNGLFDAEGVDYTLSFLSGIWTVTFTTAPTTGVILSAVFAPGVFTPQVFPGGAELETNGTPNSTQTLLNLSAGSNVTLTEVAGTVTVAASGTFSGSAAHFVGTGSSPTIAPGPDAGVGAAASMISGAKDASGSFQVTMGTGTSGNDGGDICTITFNVAYGAIANVILFAQEQNAAGLSGVYCIGSTGSFEVRSIGVPSTGDTYIWTYLVIGQ